MLVISFTVGMSTSTGEVSLVRLLRKLLNSDFDYLTQSLF